MGLSIRRVLALGTVLSLGGCSFATDALFPSFMEDGTTAPAAAAPASSSSSATEFQPAPVASAPPSNFSSGFGSTFVSQKVNQFRNELSQLRSTLAARSGQLESIRAQTVNSASAYHSTVGGIKSRLQVGTTPGNPQLMGQWQSAQSQLTRIEGDVGNMNQLAAQVSADSAMSSYLLDSVRAAYGLTGAVDNDHRQLRQLEDEVNQTTVTIQRLLGEINNDISRQQQFVANERESLMELAADINAGQLYGAQRASDGGGMQMASAVPGDFSQRRPLVVIRFDRQDVSYEPALYQAVSRALERRPEAVFDLVAVSPGSGSQNLTTGSARRNAERVLNSLSSMGLPSDRVMLSAMASPTAQSAEVHLYVR